jgi:PAS domain S-box-containing protein
LGYWTPNVGFYFLNTKKLSGRVDKSLTEFSEVVIYHISKITNAIRGAFYTLVHQRIEATGGYACTINSLGSKSFEIGEGLIGQSVKSQEILYLTNLPQQNLSVMSASGAVSARAVIIVPLIFNEKAYGVVELLYIEELEEKYHNLLSRLSRNIATMLQSIQSNSETKRLLHNSIQQAEALRSAEEELRQNMEEIQTIREDIERKNNDLQLQINLGNALKKELETRMNIINRTTLVTESDLYGAITYVNEKFCEVAKYHADEVIGKPHSILRHPDNPKELFKELWTTIKSGRIFQGTYPNKAKDGSTYWVEATIAPVFDEKGNIIKYIGVRYDITERVEQEEKTKQLLLQTQQNADEIRAQEEELRQNMEELVATQEEVQRMNKDLEIMLNAADECLFIIELSTDSKLIKCNQKFLAAMGYMDSELLNNDYRILMDTDEYNNYLETLSQLQTGKIVRKVVKRHKKNGELVHLDATYYPVRNKYGQLVKIFKLSYNITEYLQNATHSALPSSPNGLTNTAIVLANRKGKTTWVSPYFTEFTGYSLSEMLNKTAGAMLQGGDTDTKTRQAIAKAITEGGSFNGKILNYAKNGKRFWCYMNLSPIIGTNQQIDGFVAVEQFEWVD